MIGQVTQEEKVVALDHPVLAPKGELRTQQRVADEAQKSAAGMSAVHRENEFLREQNARLNRKIIRYVQYAAELQKMLFANLQQVESFTTKVDEKLYVQIKTLVQAVKKLQQILPGFGPVHSPAKNGQESHVDAQTQDKEEMDKTIEDKEKRIEISEAARPFCENILMQLTKVRLELHSKVKAFENHTKDVLTKKPHNEAKEAYILCLSRKGLLERERFMSGEEDHKGNFSYDSNSSQQSGITKLPQHESVQNRQND